MPPTLPFPNWHIDPKLGKKDTTTALLIFIFILVCALLFGASFEKICRRMRQGDERQALRTWSDAGPRRKLAAEDENLVGSEYDGKVDEWGLFPEKAAEAGDGDGGDGRGVCKELGTSYGTFGL